MSSEIDPDFLELVRAGLADAVPFARHSGVVLQEVADGAAVASLPPAPEILNHVATVHAGAVFTLAETASGAAVAGAFAAQLAHNRPVVSAASVTSTRPATAPLRAVATLTTPGPELRTALAAEGRVRFHADVDVVDARNRQVARMQATWSVGRRRGGTAPR